MPHIRSYTDRLSRCLDPLGVVLDPKGCHEHVNRGDHIRQQLVIAGDVAFVLGQFAPFMGLGENFPLAGRQPGRFQQDLKHEIPVVRPITLPSEPVQCQRMSGVVSEIKTAFV